MNRSPRSQLWARPSAIAIVYLAIALVTTWPLAIRLSSELAGDRGDTLFNCWILLWTSGQVLRALHGDVAALGEYWNANIFYPAPLTLAYSEHLTPQMLQALPAIALTGNIVLAYNLVFLATIVLSGLGMYLLVRELTGMPAAAFLAGAAFAFAPYRIDQHEHLQVLSSQWMPFALYGFRRFFVTSRMRALIGGAAALMAQALSCGYYLAYFTPFACAYVLYELFARGRARHARTWFALFAVGAGAAVLVAAFLSPYARVRQSSIAGLRDIAEIEHFSADTHAFATVSNRSILWGSRVRALPHDEGYGFPGFTILAFAAIAVGGAIAAGIRRAQGAAAPPRQWQRTVAATAGSVLAALLLLWLVVLVRGPDVVTIGGVQFRYGSNQLVLQIAIAAIVLAAASMRFRRFVRGERGSTIAFFGWAAAAAAAMSLGPSMYAGGKRIGPGPYDLFYEWVPGFNGLRVPSLNFMIVAFMLAVLAGLGSAYLISTRRRLGEWAAAIGAAAIVVESLSVTPPTAPPPLGEIYASVEHLPAGSVLAEFPFGSVASEIVYTYHAGFHRRPMLNGYSGFFPASYNLLVARLAPVPSSDQSWQALIASGATHAIVHDGETAAAIRDWLRQNGAREMAAANADRLFQLR